VPWRSSRRCSSAWPASEIEVAEPLPIEFSEASPAIIGASEAMQWVNAHHGHGPITRHAIYVLESLDAIDLAFDTLAVALLDGEVDTSGYPDYSAIVGGVASHWDEGTGDMLVRAVVGWGGRGVRGDTDRIAGRILAGLSRTSWRASTRWASRRWTVGAGRGPGRAGVCPLRLRLGPRAGVLLPEVRHAAPPRLSGPGRSECRSTITSAAPAATASRCSTGSTSRAPTSAPSAKARSIAPSSRRPSSSRAAAGPGWTVAHRALPRSGRDRATRPARSRATRPTSRATAGDKAGDKAGDGSSGSLPAPSAGSRATRGSSD